MGVIVDSNVLLDLFIGDDVWGDWSSRTLAAISERYPLVINPVIYGEISVNFDTIMELEDSLPTDMFTREAIPFEAAFLAAKAFQDYRTRGGTKSSTLPDFFIGAHATVSRHKLLTRDPRGYRSYFPTVELISPARPS